MNSMDSMIGLSGCIADLRCRFGVGFLEALDRRPAPSTDEPMPGPVHRYSWVPRIGSNFRPLVAGRGSQAGGVRGSIRSSP